MGRSARDERLLRALEEVRARCPVNERRASDPVEFVHQYADVLDRELVALLASAMAFGNVKALRAKIADALARIGPEVARAAEDPEALRSCLRGWKHRVYTAEDLVCLLLGARRMQREAGSLGEALADALRRTGTLREALSSWTQGIRVAGGLQHRATRGAAHILADPGKGSAAKRLLLMLRWMARPADGVDLGMWPIPPAALIIPVDVHIQKLGYNIGLTDRRTTNWKTAEEITAALRRFDPEDPVKYDFALCHLGMLQRCPSRRDPARCDGCGVMPVCRHWSQEVRREGRKAQTDG
ncbi:TIGR02757 family protein [Chondromyces crocatus]|uniref:TIGR02757 family protein n=1 Tax=Chondromyces crocatus TaxID=52 RepID=A0A0K1ER34_CHOCO|nr:TIGR02757 family protein [Chondromyces crocatus]AKT43284.1 uncharacterized protein CMC5_075160 [Chondromyces crocatus]